ncbi:MAG: 3-hydroxyacyl-ACP dehydratase FabZ [Alphaproteobacteria bacterium]|nr:3-hydroxyacyl-ACP dehydratase FabZ [Alphaproteobacteria bacterium]
MSNQPQETKDFNINDIMKMLPHRYPFLLVDRAMNVIPNEKGVGIKNVTVNEPFFQGHFPGNPVMPGVLQVEAMAQTAGVVMMSGFPEKDLEKKAVLFMAIDGVKFRKTVLPGDTLEMRVERMQTVRNVHKFKCESFVDDKKVCEGVLTAMIFDKE